MFCFLRQARKPLLQEFLRLTFRQHKLYFSTKKIASVKQLENNETSPKEINEEIKSGRSFGELGVSKERIELLEKQGIKRTFPIQEKSYAIIKAGKDLVGRSKTGTGKTLAFILPLIERYETTPITNNGSPYLLILSCVFYFIFFDQSGKCAK